MGDWLVSFKGRNHSGAVQQNFLWQEGCVYVMDNHRAALWCWLQKIDPQSRHSLLHIDQHTDTLQSKLKEWVDALPDLKGISIDQYLRCSYQSGSDTLPIFRWDNYLSIYLDVYGSNLDTCRFATHDVGDKPNHHQVMNCRVWELPQNMDYWLCGQKAPWIVNVDLDYFFAEGRERTDLMVSDFYIEECFESLKQKIDQDIVKVVTICLTPDRPLTAGWDASERLARKICKLLGVNFKLP